MANPHCRLFVKIGWMDHYRGSSRRDPLIVRNEAMPVNNFNGHEARMFLPIDDRVYGGFWPGFTRDGKIREVHLENFPETDYRVLYKDGIDVIFLAPKPGESGLYLVGSYRSARVYRHLQVPPDQKFEYNVTTKIENIRPIASADRKRFTGIDWRQGAYRYYTRSEAAVFGEITKQCGLR